MGKDPYSILGVSRDVSDEELKKQYRLLCRKYHPDVNQGNPQAEEMFKEVQQAYQQIMDERKDPYRAFSGQSYGGYGNPGSSGGYGGFGGYGNPGSYGSSGSGVGAGQSQYESHMNAAMNYIRSGHYAEAINVLDGIPEHTARWFYFYAYANYGMGNNIAAQQYAQTAVNMEPNNPEYVHFLRQLQGAAGWYQQQQQPYRMYRMDGGNVCLNLCIANLVCNACCGGHVFCC